MEPDTTPDPINLALIANTPYLQVDNPDLQAAISGADLVVSLGGVDLAVLHDALPPGKPALAVLGPQDHYDPNLTPNIKGLHASGFNFRNWLVAGISGAPRLSEASGLYIPEREAEQLLANLPQAYMFFSYAYPRGLRESMTTPEHAMQAIDGYLIDKPPVYYFYANPHQTIVEEYGDVLAIGVNGIFQPPALEYI